MGHRAPKTKKYQSSCFECTKCCPNVINNAPYANKRVPKVSKKKCLLVGSYNPSKALIFSHLFTLEISLNHYLGLYVNLIIFGDLNSDIEEEAMDNFCKLYGHKSLIKFPMCFKSTKNPSCIDLIFKNRTQNFHILRL